MPSFRAVRPRTAQSSRRKFCNESGPAHDPQPRHGGHAAGPAGRLRRIRRRGPGRPARRRRRGLPARHRYRHVARFVASRSRRPGATHRRAELRRARHAGRPAPGRRARPGPGCARRPGRRRPGRRPGLLPVHPDRPALPDGRRPDPAGRALWLRIQPRNQDRSRDRRQSRAHARLPAVRAVEAGVAQRHRFRRQGIPGPRLFGAAVRPGGARRGHRPGPAAPGSRRVRAGTARLPGCHGRNDRAGHRPGLPARRRNSVRIGPPDLAACRTGGLLRRRSRIRRRRGREHPRTWPS